MDSLCDEALRIIRYALSLFPESNVAPHRQ